MQLFSNSNVSLRNTQFDRCTRPRPDGIPFRTRRISPVLTRKELQAIVMEMVD
jgi:hypothetical protein